MVIVPQRPYCPTHLITVLMAAFIVFTIRRTKLPFVKSLYRKRLVGKQLSHRIRGINVLYRKLENTYPLI